MSTALIIGLAVVALVIIVALAANRGGPRVTEITRTVEKDSDDA
jgi:hypothetical protein